MSQHSRRRVRASFSVGLLSLFCLAALTTAASAQSNAAAAAKAAAAMQSLQGAAGGTLRVTSSPITGLPSHVATQPGRALASGAVASASAESRARSFLNSYGASFGLSGAADVGLISTKGPDEVQQEHVRFQQLHDGIPIAGAELIVHLRGSDVVAVNGHSLAAAFPNTTATLTKSDAVATAIGVTDKHRQAAGAPAANGALRAAEAHQEWLDAKFFQRQGVSTPQLAWYVEVVGDAVREAVWVDATNGAILLQFNQITDSRNRLVYTANGGSSLPGTLIRTEGSADTADTDGNYAYRYAGDTYDYYAAQFGRDSYDNAGATLSSTVHWCDAFQCGSCPCQNAFCDGTQMIYGEGFSQSDDVVAHELTHAVTERTAGLVYCLQSGALNESYSDIFGETVDLTNGHGNDAAGVRWLMGEEIPGIGAIRNMMSPNDFGDPGRVGDTQFGCYTSCFDWDNGGVHSNSGVPNHAYALMVDGGSYNGFSISGIGTVKAGKVQYRALTTYLTSDATFLDNYNALLQSCNDLVGTSGITFADCTQINYALDAVEMGGSVCGVTVCGNGSVESGEQCDDGNPYNCDGCDSNCTFTGCGNGIAACGEQCDDGNGDAGDGCEANCTNTPGCATFTAADLPQPIPDLGTAVSTFDIAPHGALTALEVRNLRGTHTFVTDLAFTLTSPNSTSVPVMNRVCSGEPNFSLSLADNASTVIPCPPTDGLKHLPSSPLSAFLGGPIHGTWTLTVNDLAGLDSGQLDGWGLLVCAAPGVCGNGQIDLGEQCDDGGTQSGDGCSSSCNIELSYPADRAACQGLIPTRKFEDFEDGDVADNNAIPCSVPLDSNTNDACFQPGEIPTGISLANTPQARPSDGLALLGLGFFGSPSKNVVANYFVDTLDMTFTEPVNTICLDLVQTAFSSADTYHMNIYGTGGDLLGTSDAYAMSSGTFWGVSSPLPIGRINFSSETQQAEGVDNIAFGLRGITTPTPTSTSGTPTPTRTATYPVPPQAFVRMESCRGGAGATAVCDVELEVVPGSQVATLQFNLTTAPQGGAPGIASNVTFVPANGIPAPSFNLNSGPETILVGWLSNFSPPLTGTLTLGTLQVPVPPSAQSGQTYLLQVVNPSATSDGDQDLVTAGESGQLLVGVPFLVCDVSPAGSDLNSDGDSYDAGEFGNGSLSNSDIVAMFRASLIPGQLPTAGSDKFGAMDSLPEDAPPVCGGNASVVNSDVVRCFRRSLIPQLPNYQRTTGNGCSSTQLGSGFEAGSSFARASTASSAKARLAASERAVAALVIGAPTREANGARRLPLQLVKLNRMRLSTLQAAVSVDGSAALQFEASGDLPEPALALRDPGALLLGWLQPLTQPIRGNATVGSLAAAAAPSYAVEVSAPSAATADGEELTLSGAVGIVSDESARRPLRRVRCDQRTLNVDEPVTCHAEDSQGQTLTAVQWFTDRPGISELRSAADGTVVVTLRAAAGVSLYAVDAQSNSMRHQKLRVGRR